MLYMKLIKKATALFLTATMLLSLMIVAPISNVLAIEGGGITSSGKIVAYGCDLSYWNVSGDTLDYSLVDFEKMVADGCEFAILRIGYEASATGVNTIDKAFVTFYNNARAAGMQLGVYFYSLATTYDGAVDDAEWVISIIEQYDMYFEYPIYYDVEDSAQVALGSTAMETLCSGWCDTLEANGYFPAIYGGGSQVIDKLSDDFKASYDVWYPRVLSATASGSQYDPTAYDWSSYCSMWQYAWYQYEYDGIGLDMLDVNVAYKDYPTIMSTYGYNNVAKDSQDLESIVENASKIYYYNYSAGALTVLHNTYNEAVAMLNSGTATDEEMTAMAEKLQAAIDNTAENEEQILSTGWSYTTTTNTRTDAYADDGAKLTDGEKGSIYGGGTGRFSGWYAPKVDIIMDLGENNTQVYDTFNIYSAYGDYGISKLSHFTISVSDDGATYTEIETSYDITETETSDTWVACLLTYTTETALSSRYVKFTVYPTSNGSSGHVWLDEVELAYVSTEAYDDGVYIDGFNTSIVAGAAQIFTPDFGTITTSNANHSWTMNVVAKYSPSLDAYVVQQVIKGTGSSTADITLADDEILIAAHEWEDGVTDGTAVAGSTLNYNNLASAQVGDILTLHQIDVANKSLGIAPYISISAPTVFPIVSLGAKANETLGGLRFGATYNDIEENGEVTGLGILVISADRLGDNTLDLGYASNTAIAKYVADIECRTIENPVDGQEFEEYSSFNFYATVIGLGDHADENLVAVPYITYVDGTVFYGEVMTNSLNGVLNGNSSF